MSKYDYEQSRLNKLENENNQLKKQLAVSIKALKEIEKQS